MNYFRNFLLWLSVFILISCSNSTSHNSGDYISLRDSSTEIEKSLEWTEELQPDTLTENLKNISGVSSSVRVNFRNLFLIGDSTKEVPVTPSVNNFGLLSYNENKLAQEAVNAFCKVMITKYEKTEDLTSGIISLMESERAYSAVVFVYELNKISSLQFKDFILGKFFYGDGFIQVPVRFYYEKIENYLNQDYLDLLLYLENKKSGWKLNQIEFCNKELISR